MFKIRSTKNKTIKLLFAFSFLAQIIFAQEPSIKGIVVDDVNTPLEFASVALLKPQDSVMVSYSITDSKGQFEILDSPSGEFLMQIYFSGFLPYYTTINFKNEVIDLKSIQLKSNVESLNEVTITAVIPVQIKKDTIAYNANSFKIHHDDNIEDLLKKLPGVELDGEGNLSSQGNEITKIYVDGKEFFSGDPSIVLKNLSADAINKIEVIDKKSDEAELTGVSDDQKNYVINLTLKKSKKRNGFGKLSGGIGLDNKYFSNLNYNKFSPRTQVSIIGKYNNINVTGSNIKNFLSANGGLTDDSDDNGSTSSFDRRKRSLSGNLTSGVGGFHIGHELKDKEVINADYFYNYLENVGTSITKRTSFTKLKNFQSDINDDNNKTTHNQHLNFNYENKRNSTSRLLVKGNFTTEKTKSDLNRDVFYYNEDGELRTFNDIKFFDDRRRDNGNVRINYYKKLNENKRNFSTGFSFSSSKNENLKDQYNLNTNNSNNKTTETTILKNELFKNNNINFNFNYTEPLGGNHFLKVQSLFFVKHGSEKTDQVKFRNSVEQTPLNYSIKNKEESYNSKLSYNYNTPVFNFNIDSEIQHLYRSFGLVTEDFFKKNQTYFNPSASIRYRPKKGSQHLLRYRRQIRSPRASQTSPVINDLNPYYIRKGNTDLKTEKIDNLSFNSNIHNFKSSLSFFTKINYQHTQDAIIQSLVIDDDYVQTRSFLNKGSQDRLTAELSLNKRVKQLGFRYNLKTKGTYRTANSIIELELNDVTTKEYLLGASIENNRKSIFDIKFGANYTINKTEFSVVEGLDREYIKQHYYSKFDYDISKKLNVNTQFDYYTYSDSNFESNQNIPFWNASVSYTFTKNNNGILKLLLIDILDKNVNIVRRSTINYFEETTNQTLGRYVILSLTMRLNSQNAKNMKKKKKKRF
ncbi:Outer membrane receptor proteins, mostly Fe transport [Lutibacter oricola]|uniref:Outer membrane receptor proteins, mostly Fe transport n=1 Tax=Lutibacter oricola TaxID=762486 RepID=A0A1H2UBN4_9FLAO|nr:outer membrane beta-barrel protein [Lutibacter oricola]SDW53546.1 Outer membrane receptor proteins, mostly Fe transport [Lutibacter oricola]